MKIKLKKINKSSSPQSISLLIKHEVLTRLSKSLCINDLLDLRKDIDITDSRRHLVGSSSYHSLQDIS
jgi:hypothetical protein